MLYCGYGNFTGEEDDLMQDRKLEQALEIYFQENPDRGSDKYQEIQKYLKLRIQKGWSRSRNVDGFPQMNWRIL